MPSELATYSAQDLEEIASGFQDRSPQEVLAWAFEEFPPKIVLACSFGGVSGMALLDMSVKINPQVRVFYLDTDFLFPETYALRDEVEQRYGIKAQGFKSRWSPEEQAREFGEALWKRDPDRCCWLRKVEPNARALEGERAWIAGLRRDQNATRAVVSVVEWDAQYELVKVNPLATWTEAQVWEYIRENDVPYNPLHDRGYASIGCTHCTRAVKPGEDPRAGRWAGFDKMECGIHVPGPDTAKEAASGLTAVQGK